MRNNKGFTLVELIVVVVILGVLATVAGLTVATVNATSARKAAAQINAYISTVRTDCMARAGEPYAVLYVEDGVVKGDYIEYGTVAEKKTVETTIVTDKRVTVTYDKGSGAVSLPTSAETGMELEFARSTGKLVQPISSGTLIISITGGGRTFTITVIAATGNHEIDG
jgi:prepilin-type N-terminal cleavage/methylation domain-containing protein